ncbi:hypothetical protein L4X63_02305 [Geomonas sp. Red32]|uniref:hypothetical protein n=1 Tax=Geomonas sp. Red32 TaxID=2912856 RepID=UPI00202CFAD4|nr:hypothetical protein [Geomonas sp. Red32]MCM0080412.1 hypothetical protein [Geomonas sp. Red32]
MKRIWMAMAALLFFLAGCASQQVAKPQVADFPDHYRQFDAALGWEVKKNPNDLIVDGVFKNLRYFQMTDIEVWVETVDPAGKVLSRSVSFIIPRTVMQDESAPFSVRLPRNAAANKLRFTYKYTGEEGGNDEGGGDLRTFQSFDTPIPQ